MDQKKAPLYSKLLAHAQKEDFSLHVPGHKNGEILPLDATNWFRPLMNLDATELSGLDDLHDPEGVIKEAQDLAALFYKSERTYFLVGGSTVGNLAMILATCEEGDTVLVQRNSHKSIINGLELANVQPIFISPAYDKENGLAIGLEKNTVKKAIEQYPEAKVLILTYPSYYGIANDIKSIIEMAKKQGLVVLVDEAHGAHLVLGSPFPASTLDLGADIVVHSAHKTLPAMTMASYLHVGKNTAVSIQKLQKYLQMLQSSSPSYPLMASLDLARYYVANFNKSDIEEMLKNIKSFKQDLDQLPFWKVAEEGEAYQVDPLKVTLKVGSSFSGKRLQERLEKVGIFSEISNEEELLFVLPLSSFKNWKEVLTTMKNALRDVPTEANQRQVDNAIQPPTISPLAISYREMKQSETIYVKVEDAMHYVMAEQVIPYPPGIPVLMAGERIDNEKYDVLKTILTNGIRLQGHSHILSTGIKVFKNRFL